MISVTEALSIVDEHIKSLPETTVELSECLGYALAQDIISNDDIPAGTNSAMDGYAVRSSDTAGASGSSPVRLQVAGEVPAGNPTEKAVESGKAFRIMTGGVLPEGADAVIPVEDTELEGDCVDIFVPASPGLNIRPAGEDISKGEKALSRGDVIRPADMGILASVGVTNVPVFRKPRVAFLITGNELIAPDESLSPGKVRNSNQYSLIGLLKECSVDWVNLGTGVDSLEEIKRKIATGMEADMIITSGAVSVGKYDFVKDAFDKLGMKRHFWRVAQKPGKPLLFGELPHSGGLPHGKPVFGLPGNPVSVMITFLIYVKRALLKMKGCREYEPLRIRATTAAPYHKSPGLTHFARGIFTHKDGSFSVIPFPNQGSGILRSMSNANCIIVFDENSKYIPEGKQVDIIFLHQF